MITLHEALHIAGFRLIGKPYRYRRGEPVVEPVVAMTHQAQLLVALAPLAVTGSLFLLFSIATGLTFSQSPGWGLFFLGLTALAGLQASFCLSDLRQAWQLLSGRDKTPFDGLIRLNERLMQPRRTRLYLWIMLIVVLTLLALELHQP